MTISNGYTTLAEYKAWIAVRGLGAVSLDPQDDGAIEILIAGSSRYIDGELPTHKFWKDSADVTRYYQAFDSTSVFIDELSAAPTSLSVDLNNDRTYTVMTVTDYDLRPDNALADNSPYSYITIAPNSSAYFPTQARGVKVIGKFGYPAVPDDIKMACLMIAQNTYSLRSGQSAAGHITVTAAGVVIRPEEVPALAQKMIDHYKSLI